MQLLMRFPHGRILGRIGFILLLVVVGLVIQLFSLHVLHASSGSANFSLQPYAPKAKNPLSQSYFIFNAAPATTILGYVRVTNTGTARGTVNIYPVDATTGPTGGVAYLDASSHFQDIGKWVALAKSSLTLNAGESKVISFNLFVPRGAVAGQHIGGVVAESTAAQHASEQAARGAVRITLRLKKLYALPIVVDVRGKLADHLAATSALFDTHSPYQRVLIVLTNTGNTILYPVGDATIINSRKSIVQKTSLRISAFLPHTSIKYPLTIGKKALPIGSYTIKFLLNYGKETKGRLTTTFTFVIRSPGKSLTTLAAHAVVREPTDFLGSLVLWQYALLGVALLLVGSGLCFWVQKAYTMIVHARRKGV